MACFLAKNIFRRDDTRCANVIVSYPKENIVIEEKLEKARLHSAKRRMQRAIALFATIGICGLLLFGLSFYDFSAKKDMPMVVADKVELSENDREKIRGEFKETLQQYENELEPRLQMANVELWNREGFFEIGELKKKMMLDFSSGEYQKALDNIHVLQNRTAKILEEAEHIFRENLAKATSFIAEDLYEEAKLHIEKSLLVAPQSPEALELQKEIEKLPLIAPLLNGAKVARAENDFQKEYGLLQQILQIAPERESVAERVPVLSELIKNQKFAEHISLGFASIEKRQAKDARYHYQEAKKVDPERAELAVLLTQVLALEKSFRVKSAVKQAEQAVRRDDWQQAKENFAKAAKDAPESKTVVEGLRRAEQVLGLQAQFNQYLNNPYRLADTDVRNGAERTLQQAEAADSYSFTIKRQAEQLRELITQLNRLIPVTVISDNKTFVLVRGVGKVGVISQKLIQLKPGKYTFEGVRDGFKSKLVQTFISYDQDNFTVQVICNEPI